MTGPLSSGVIKAKVIELQKSLLVTCNVLRLFVNTLTADEKYSLISRDNSIQTIQMHLSQKQNLFSQFFSAFFDSALNLEHFQKHLTLIAYVFPNLPTAKDCLYKCLKAPCLRGHVDSGHGKRAEGLIQS